MIKRAIFLISIITACYLGFPTETLAADSKFQTTYKTTYDVAANGVTTVTSNVTLINNSAGYYAEKFKLTTSLPHVYDVAAYDRYGACQVDLSGQNINVTFNDKVVGVGAKLNFKLEYKTSDIALPRGRLWEINLPKIEGAADAVNTTILTVPASFGPAVGLQNLLIGQNLSGDKVSYVLSDEELHKNGAVISFGADQILNFSLKYHLKNTGLLPTFEDVTLPSSLQNIQAVTILKSDPPPLTVKKDGDGNQLARYFLWPGEEKEITVGGVAKVLNREITPQVGDVLTAAPANLKYLLNSQPFWEVNNSSIQQIARGLKAPQTIYEYVVSTLSYNPSKGFDNRLGAAAVLKDPANSVCGEFADLFVTLCRAAGIPARELEGYVMPEAGARPLASDVLHAWAEFYDPTWGWVAVDPTWGNTAKTDFFSHLDATRLVLAVHGASSTSPAPAGAYKLDINEKDQVQVSFGTEYPETSGQTVVIMPNNVFDQLVQFVASVF